MQLSFALKVVLYWVILVFISTGCIRIWRELRTKARSVVIFLSRLTLLGSVFLLSLAFRRIIINHKLPLVIFHWPNEQLLRTRPQIFGISSRQYVLILCRVRSVCRMTWRHREICIWFVTELLARVRNFPRPHCHCAADGSRTLVHCAKNYLLICGQSSSALWSVQVVSVYYVAFRNTVNYSAPSYGALITITRRFIYIRSVASSCRHRYQKFSRFHWLQKVKLLFPCCHLLASGCSWKLWKSELCFELTLYSDRTCIHSQVCMHLWAYWGFSVGHTNIADVHSQRV